MNQLQRRLLRFQKYDELVKELEGPDTLARLRSARAEARKEAAIWDDSDYLVDHLEEIMQSIKIHPLRVPEGGYKNGFIPFFRECKDKILSSLSQYESVEVTESDKKCELMIFFDGKMVVKDINKWADGVSYADNIGVDHIGHGEALIFSAVYVPRREM